MYLKKYNLRNKTSLVTGAGKGLGRACAIALAEAGSNLIIISRTKKVVFFNFLQLSSKSGPLWGVNPSTPSQHFSMWRENGEISPIFTNDVLFSENGEIM